MAIYHVQDSDRSCWVLATDWADALRQWKQVIAAENDGDDAEPNGIYRVCEDNELIINGAVHGD